MPDTTTTPPPPPTTTTIPPPPAPAPAPPPTPPPPVYTPTVPFVVVESPPPYSAKAHDQPDRARRGAAGRVCGVKTVNLVAVLALLVATAVIAGGVYGYQNRGSSDGSTDDDGDTAVVPADPGMGMVRE